MTVFANGKQYSCACDAQLVAFLQSIQMDIERVVVEHNETALTREEAKRVTLADGDKLELLRIVAGG
ncbi:MAG: thiamine biosynthesis protein ThiS [Verrucomicrobia bacterium CG1_02_43_26]|nr:MAG: thiamine biosynthesis protein ThiS [Verrucomicrobia bacterium CG1_02_43_26]